MKKKLNLQTLFRKAGLILMTVSVIAGSVFTAPSKKTYASELSGKTATEICDMIGVGWNLGNTFDADGGNLLNITSFETAWGNPVVTEELIKGVHDAGFNAIRIPVTWYRAFSDKKNYIIYDNYLDRINEIIDLCYKYDMFIILNIHHEAWLNKASLVRDRIEIGNELAAVWAQIADRFADYDQHLIFEGMNEPRLKGTAQEWNGSKEGSQAVNYLCQVFVETVRGNGSGHNPERCLMIPSYAASCSSDLMNAVSLPTWNGTVVNNLIIEIHSYSPYEFCLSNKKTFDPNNASDAGSIDSVFRNIENTFLNYGIPVILDETSATNNGNPEARAEWMRYTGKNSAGYGVPIFLWDNGVNKTSGGECHSYIDRKTGEVVDRTLLDALFEGYSSVEKYSLRKGTESTVSSSASLSGGNVMWSNSEGLKNTAQWDYNYIKFPSDPGFYSSDREIMIYYKAEGSGEPKVILDCNSAQAYWIPVEPARKETAGDFKVAVFTYDMITKACQTNNVKDLSALTNFSLVAANGDITTYEIASVGGTPKVTYRANGMVYHTGTDMPEKPEYEGLDFIGWFSTKTYDEGTEFTGENVSSDMTVYAAFKLGAANTGDTGNGSDASAENTPDATKTPENTVTNEASATATPAPEVSEGTDNAKSSVSKTIAIIGASIFGVALVTIGVIFLIQRKKK